MENQINNNNNNSTITIKNNNMNNTIENKKMNREREILLNQLLRVKGIGLGDNQKLTSSKTPKQKLLFSISKEIGILETRDSLELKVFKKGDTYINKQGVEDKYLNDRIENRFHKNPIGNQVLFNLKHKGKIIDFNNNQSFTCENDIESLINMYKSIYSVVGSFDDDNEIWDDKIFKTPKK